MDVCTYYFVRAFSVNSEDQNLQCNTLKEKKTRLHDRSAGTYAFYLVYTVYKKVVH